MTAAMINAELGRAANAAFSLNGAAERSLAGKPSGAISFGDFYGKANLVQEGPYGSLTAPQYNWRTHASTGALTAILWNNQALVTNLNLPVTSYYIAPWTYYRHQDLNGNNQYWSLYRQRQGP